MLTNGSTPSNPMDRVPSVEEMCRLQAQGELVQQLQTWFADVDSLLPKNAASRGAYLFQLFLDSDYDRWRLRVRQQFKIIEELRRERDAFQAFWIAVAEASHGFRDDSERAVLQRLAVTAAKAARGAS